MDQVMCELRQVGLVPVLRVDRAEDAIPLAHALVDGGLPVAEITFRTSAAAEAIRRVACEFPEMLLGAGTVLTIQQAAQAVEAGAKYIVSPGFDSTIVDWCVERAIPITPGVATPSEVMAAMSRGLQHLKFFPAEELGGVRMLKTLAGPFGGVQFIPTGGITAATLPDYLRLANVVAVGGSWIATATLVAAGRFEEIRRLAEEARQIVASVRAGIRAST